MLGIGTNAATNGRVTELIREFCSTEPESTQNIEPESAQIMENRTPESEIYAPPILFCDETRLFFANSRGMVIYDRTKEKVTATIDLHEIDCHYFTANSLETRILVEGNTILVFNEKNEKVQGDSYVFEISASEEPDTVLNLKPIETKRDGSLAEKWEKTMGKRYVDTFERVDPATMCAWEEGKAEGIQFSKKSVLWTSEKGEHFMSCLLTEQDSYKLYTVNTETGNSDTQQLTIIIPEVLSIQNEKANTLPRYEHTGKDMKMKAIYDYLVEHETEEEEYPRRAIGSRKERDHVYDDNGSGGVWKYSGGAEVKTDVFWQTDMESE